MQHSEAGPVLVLGDGGWGTALAMLLVEKGIEVRLWSHDPAYAAVMRSSRRNPKFLPEVLLPPEIRIESDMGALAAGVSTVFSVIPTQFLRGSLHRVGQLLPPSGLFVSCTKGLERETFKRPSEILGDFLPRAPVVVVSGPSHAEEVCRRLPTTVVAASTNAAAAVEIQRLLNGPRFRVYTSADPLGVEIAGSTKNIIAIAAGIADGLGFGDNARAGLLTRGLREITRLGVALGALPDTFSGLAGVGDLIVTCTSTHSRNHTVGYRVGRGESLQDILRSTEKVAEGVETTRSVHELAGGLGVEVPITNEVHEVLFRSKPPRQAVEALMSRQLKEEIE